MENKKMIEYGLWISGGLLIIGGTVQLFRGDKTGSYMIAAGGVGVHSAIPYFVKRNITILKDEDNLESIIKN